MLNLPRLGISIERKQEFFLLDDTESTDMNQNLLFS